jgi:WD40 repeat protein
MLLRSVRNLGSIPTDTFGRRQAKIQLRGHTATVRYVSALSSKSVITASRDTTLKLWNVETGECEATFEGILQQFAQWLITVTSLFLQAMIMMQEFGACKRKSACMF